jgi:hypothetical protein
LHIDGAEKYILSFYLSGSACTTGASLSTLLKHTNLFFYVTTDRKPEQGLVFIEMYALLINVHFGATYSTSLFNPKKNKLFFDRTA